MGSWPAADADRWWACLPPRRREQIHRMMDRGTKKDPIPEDQLALGVPTEESSDAA